MMSFGRNPLYTGALLDICWAFCNEPVKEAYWFVPDIEGGAAAEEEA